MFFDLRIWHEGGPSGAGESPDASWRLHRIILELGGALMPRTGAKEVNWEDALGPVLEPKK